MSEGEQLRLFIDNQPKSKISIARDLKITKQTLFQYFKSKILEPETKKRFETYFDKVIFTGKHTELAEAAAPYQKTSQTESEVIELLKSQIRMLENHCTFVQKMYEDMKNKTDVNLLTALDNQRVQMRQLAVLAHQTAKHYAGGDKKKFEAELNEIDRLMTADFR